MKHVLVLQELLPQYRIPFFVDLRAQLEEVGVALHVGHGVATGSRAEHGDEARLPWAEEVPVKRLSFAGRTLVWQSGLRAARRADLVIVEHANRLLLNAVLIALSRLRLSAPVAFWGHGANLQGKRPGGVLEKVKARSARWPFWWFAYTAGSAERVVSAGFPRRRVTVVQNSVQTPARRVDAPRAELRCIFLGSLHEYKRIEFLLAAGATVYSHLPDFELVIVGAGPERALVEQWAAREPWVTYLGPLFGTDQASVLGSAQLLLIPGLVGLAVVDSFASQTPVVTIEQRQHSPEFEYLEHGVNGIILCEGATATEYGEHVARLLQDRVALDGLRDGCCSSQQIYTLQHMVDRFADGISQALQAGRP